MCSAVPAFCCCKPIRRLHNIVIVKTGHKHLIEAKARCYCRWCGVRTLRSSSPEQPSPLSSRSSQLRMKTPAQIPSGSASQRNGSRRKRSHSLLAPTSRSPITSCPACRSISAATAESTPPEIPTATVRLRSPVVAGPGTRLGNDCAGADACRLCCGRTPCCAWRRRGAEVELEDPLPVHLRPLTAHSLVASAAVGGGRVLAAVCSPSSPQPTAHARHTLAAAAETTRARGCRASMSDSRAVVPDGCPVAVRSVFERPRSLRSSEQ